MTHSEGPDRSDSGGDASCDLPIQVIVATTFRAVGTTGVHTHFHQAAQYLKELGTPVKVVTPFSWARLLTYPTFAPRLILHRVSPPTSVIWYRYWHEMFLRNALRRELASTGNCVIYAQGPLEARAALKTRRGPHQRVVMAVHFRTSQADEYAEPGRELKPDSAIFRAIRKVEFDTIPRLDGMVYVTRWAQEALLSWLPEAASVPSTVISNFIAPMSPEAQASVTGEGQLADLVTTGRLDDRKNHSFILDVLAEARKSGHQYTLDIYGEGPGRKVLERHIATLGLADQVRLKGFRSDVRQFLPRYRAYVHAAYAETSSLAIIEAMAVGLPVVAGGIGPIAELYDDGVEGRFWPLNNPAEAAGVLSQILESESLRTKTGQAATQRFQRDYSAAVLGPRIKSFLLDPPTAHAIS